MFHLDGQRQRSRHASSDSQDQDECNIMIVSSTTEGQGSGGRNCGIALLHIGQNNLSLLSLDTKTHIMESKFSNISFVSQVNPQFDVLL